MKRKSLTPGWHVGLDNQHMTHLHQKWMNVFIRFTIEGEPYLGVLGVLRVFGKSTGQTLYETFKNMVEGKIQQQLGLTDHLIFIKCLFYSWNRINFSRLDSVTRRGY